MDGIGITVELESNYPFSNALKYIITTDGSAEFDLAVRIPEWCKTVFVNGTAYTAESGFVHINKIWKDTETVLVNLSRDIELIKRPNNMSAVKYGPLIFSLPIKGEWEKEEYTKDGVERKFPYCDYEIHCKSDWNYAFADDKFVLIEEEQQETAFSEQHPMLKIKAKMQKIDWGYEKNYTNVCAEFPKSLNKTDEVEDMFLQPYGSTILRMTEMPVIPPKSK